MYTYYVYLLTNVKRNVMYVGVTNNLENRVNTLVYAEEYQQIEEAIAREKQIKGWRRSKKDALVEALNPTWADLLDPGVSKGPSLRSG